MLSVEMKATVRAKDLPQLCAVPSLPPPYRCFPENDGCVVLTLNILLVVIHISSISVAAPERSSPDAHAGFTLSPLERSQNLQRKNAARASKFRGETT